VNYRDGELSAALAIVAKRRLSDFNAQDVPNTAWAFATVYYRDETLSAAFAIVPELRLSEFKP